MKSLIIAEKPSVAGDIAAAIGGFQKSGSVYERDNLVITNAIGHLVELHVPEAEGTGGGLDTLPVIPAMFGLKVVERTKDQFSVVQRQLRRNDIDCVINACDAGREGELIFRLIMEKADCRKPTLRMWFRSMTHDALREAFESAKPGVEYDRLRDAAKSRSEADWLIGINGSRGLTSLRQHQTGKYEGLTAGRVQTPTLAIVVHRESEIRNFVAKDFWEVIGTFGVAAGQYKAKWRRPIGTDEEKTEATDDAARFFERAAAHEIVSRCAGQPVDHAVDDVVEGSQLPPRLFDLTTLQREANKRFKLPVKKVLDIAQRLYETHKVTTYPRTESSALPEDYVQKVKETMGALEASEWGRFARQVGDSGWVQPTKRIFDNSKISDHFAIIPTGVIPHNLDADEKRIFELIVRRFLAAFFPAAEFKTTKRTTVVAGETFTTSGKVTTSLGWKTVLDEVVDEGETQADTKSGLCALQDGETPSNDAIEAKAGKTTAPSRFTEASLLGAMVTAGNLVDDEELREAMKDKGLGTPATRAATLETLLNDRDGKGNAKEPYIRRDKSFLVPTPKAMRLIDFLESCGIGFLTSAQTTGEWEERLNRMARGQYPRATFMQEIAETTRNLITTLRDEAGKAPKAEAPSTQLACKCPSCGAGIKRTERFFECTNACGFKLWAELMKRPFQNAEVERLLAGETLPGLDGFYSENKKRNFSAGLRMTPEFKVELVFGQEGGDGGGQRGNVNPAVRLASLCPKCDGVMASRPALVACVDCDFKVWREAFGKTFTDKQLDQLVYRGEIKNVNGLVSRGSGNTYSATVRLDPKTGKMELIFPDRK